MSVKRQWHRRLAPFISGLPMPRKRNDCLSAILLLDLFRLETILEPAFDANSFQTIWTLVEFSAHPKQLFVGRDKNLFKLDCRVNIIIIIIIIITSA